MLGRNFLPDEDLPGHDRVAILSYAAWSARFGADRDIAGKAITLNDESYTVVDTSDSTIDEVVAAIVRVVKSDA